MLKSQQGARSSQLSSQNSPDSRRLLLGSMPDPREGFQAVRYMVVQRVFYILLFIGTLVVIGAAYEAYQLQTFGELLFLLPSYLILLVLTFLPRVVPQAARVIYHFQVGFLLVGLYLMAGLTIAGFSQFPGVHILDGLPLLLAMPVIATLFLGRRAGLVSFGLIAVTTGVLNFLLVNDTLTPPPAQLTVAMTASSWVNRGLIIFALTLLLVLSEDSFFRFLTRAMEQMRELTEALVRSREDLEAEVDVRTEELKRRARYLEAAAVVARESVTVLDDPQQLIAEVVQLVSQEFDFYHTGLFLVGNDGWAELRAASSAGGRRMLQRGHRLRVGEQGIVGYVASVGEPRVALDVGGDAVYFDNPDLPDTRSEMALPLRVRGNVIGVLDVQSTERQAFDEEDVATLQILADQVAMAINSARLFEQAQRSAEVERRALEELSAGQWQEMLSVERGLGFINDGSVTLPAGDLARPEMSEALTMERPAFGPTSAGDHVPAEGEPLTDLAMPIRVRGQVVGVVGGRKEEGAGSWSAEEVELLSALTEQLNIALEGAQLYHQTQLRAQREQLARQITDRMRGSLSWEELLQTTLREMGRVLGTSRSYVQWASPRQLATPDDNGEEELSHDA